MKCSCCQHDNPPGAKFCEECAAPLQRACANCGALVSPAAKFCSECAHPVGKAAAAPEQFDAPERHTPKHLAEKIPASKSAPEGERRQLTVLFCDMVGFTELANRVDPEVLQRIIRTYEDACAVCITRYEGYVFQRLGDGIVAFFGYPLAHEGEAERAIHAGLEIIEALSKLDVPDADHLAVRIGIATGLVVVSSAEKGAVGETMNLASRLQGIAQPGRIVVSERVHRLAGGSFEYQDLGEQSLKGIAQPTHAYGVIGASQAASRFEAATQEGLTPLVGREQEIGLLLERWALAHDGEGQVVLLSGEPGIGKSRILSALRDRLEGQGAQTLRFQCSPYYVNSAFWPSIDNFERALKFGRDESPDSKLDKLEALIVTHYGRPLGDVRFVASMLSIPCEARYGAITMTPQKHKDETLRTLVDLSEAAARRQPSVMLFEDVHWADPTTLEMLDLLIDRVRTIPLLIVLTHRPEFQSRSSEQGHVSGLNLSKLTRVQSAAIVSRLAAGKALPAALLEQILAKTDGVPLFVEELTKSILESGEIKDAGDRYEYSGTGHTITIPATLRDSLMARLDRVMPVKEVAQIGACIGREFSYELLAAVSPLNGGRLENALEQLTKTGLVFRRGTPPDAVYTFKHALVQDAAYDSLLKTKRAQLHAQIAKVLEEYFPEIAATQPELIARHYTEAGLSISAIPYWLKAGELCIARAAHQEALVHLREGLNLVTAQPASIARSDMELAYQMNIGSAYNVLQGWSAPGVKVAYERARELATEVSDPRRSFNALMGLFYYYNVAGQIKASTPIIEEAASVAEATGFVDQLVVARQGRGQNLLYRGRFAQSAESFSGSLAAYDRQRHAYLSNIWGGDFFSYDQGFIAFCYWHLGQMRTARDAVRKCIEHANSFEDPIVHIVGYVMAAVASVLLRDWQAVMNYALISETKAEAYGMMFHRNFCPILRGCAMVHTGAGREGHDLMKTHLEVTRASGLGWLNPWLRSHLALSHGMRNEHEIAMDVLRAARHDAQALGDTWALGLFDLTEADIVERQGELDAACMVLERAVAFSREQPSKGVELRAATSLARLMQGQGRKKEALELLAPIYNWFTEGFDTNDLKEAKALLDELA